MTRMIVLVAVAPLFLVAADPSKAQTWSDTRTLGDWGGRDSIPCSVGSKPNSNRCKPASVGRVAVCWSNRQTGECGNARAWCTYKDNSVGLHTFPNGGSPGEIYACGLGTATDEISICHGENAGKIINFNPFLDTRAFEHSCAEHPGWTVFEGCAGGGANPAVSAKALCGGQWTAKAKFPPIGGNACGYSWFIITCWSGQ
jgi:hypothetical protein